MGLSTIRQKTKKRTDQSRPLDISQSKTDDSSSSMDSIQQNYDFVNTGSTDTRYSVDLRAGDPSAVINAMGLEPGVGLRQFGNKTAI